LVIVLLVIVVLFVAVLAVMSYLKGFYFWQALLIKLRAFYRLWSLVESQTPQMKPPVAIATYPFGLAGGCSWWVNACTKATSSKMKRLILLAVKKPIRKLKTLTVTHHGSFQFSVFLSLGVFHGLNS
jgi:hypothetical protein